MLRWAVNSYVVVPQYEPQGNHFHWLGSKSPGRWGVCGGILQNSALRARQAAVHFVAGAPQMSLCLRLGPWQAHFRVFGLLDVRSLARRKVTLSHKKDQRSVASGCCHALCGVTDTEGHPPKAVCSQWFWWILPVVIFFSQGQGHASDRMHGIESESVND